ncbi:PAS domain S-box protein [Cupriavidus plantarum]
MQLPHPASLLSDSARADVYRTLVETVSDYAIFTLDANGVVTSWNRGAQRIKGYEADDILGSHFSRFYTEERCATMLEKCLATRRSLVT